MDRYQIVRIAESKGWMYNSIMQKLYKSHFRICLKHTEITFEHFVPGFGWICDKTVKFDTLFPTMFKEMLAEF